MSISQDLHAYLSEAMGHTFEYGELDCCLWPADWCVSQGWSDPAARWRGKYEGLSGAFGYVMDHGLEALWTLGMVDAGIPEADEPQLGDVGIVKCGTDMGGVIGAIYGGKRWHALGTRGLFSAHMEPVKVWRVRDPVREACRG